MDIIALFYCSDGVKVLDHIDIHLRNASGVVSDDITFLTLRSNLDIADVHMWDTKLAGNSLIFIHLLKMH